MYDYDKMLREVDRAFYFFAGTVIFIGIVTGIATIIMLTMTIKGA